jgi:hypothetical protein
MKKKEELTAFEVLDIISSAYAGKQVFFLEPSGVVYDREEGEYVTLEDAVYRMAERLEWKGDE